MAPIPPNPRASPAKPWRPSQPPTLGPPRQSRGGPRNPQPSGLPGKAVAALVNPIARVFLMPEVFADGANRDGAVGDGRGHAARRGVAGVAPPRHTGAGRL